MSLTVEQVEHIAELAKLQLTAEEKELFREQLSAVLDDAARLARVDTAQIPPTATVLPLRRVLREDQARPGWPRDAVLANAPSHTETFFEVQAVFESGAGENEPPGREGAPPA